MVATKQEARGTQRDFSHGFAQFVHQEPPAKLAEQMVILKVDVSEAEAKENARWAGREKQEKSKEQAAS